MADAAHVLDRLRQRHARHVVREPTTELTKPRDVAPAVPAAVPPQEAAVPAQQESRRRRPGAWVVAALSALLALAAVVGFLLLEGDPAGRSSAQDPSGTPRSGHHTARGGGSPSVTSSPSSPQPTSTSPRTKPTSGPRPVNGASAEQFVRSYYAALPSGTRAGWSALSPGFQDQIGGYGSYEGFWSTISRVSVGDTTPAGNGAVDVSLTYTSNDGSTESEVRRLFLSRQGSQYLITDDAVVG
jgi:hypothetical protein